ncbi:MAG: hypothetical protein KUL82_14245 [Bdellovibrio sp.]|nr:hypothetical protein [Bdellovibrio sp.]
MFKYVLSLALAAYLSGCSKSSNIEGESRVSVSGGSTIRGSVIVGAECGASSARIHLSGVYGAQSFYNVTINSGGTFDFQVNPGRYSLAAYAGSCTVNSEVSTQTNAVMNYQVCLGSNCTSVASGATVYNSFSKPTEISETAASSGPLCQWNIYGCAGWMYPGWGDANFSKTNIYFTAKEDSAFALDLDFSKGNNALAAIPSLGKSGWNGLLRKNGNLEFASAALGQDTSSKKISLGSLFYETQVDSKLLQFESGFCEPKEKALSSMIEYLRLSGFTNRPIEDFAAHWKDHLPSADTLCVYPQNQNIIETIVSYRTPQKMESRRLWFLVLPRIDSAMLKVRPIPQKLTQWFNPPKANAIAELRKAPQSRAIASEPGILAEECSVGFLLER